jgi:hypothetical protein
MKLFTHFNKELNYCLSDPYGYYINNKKLPLKINKTGSINNINRTKNTTVSFIKRQKALNDILNINQYIDPICLDNYELDDDNFEQDIDEVKLVTLDIKNIKTVTQDINKVKTVKIVKTVTQDIHNEYNIDRDIKCILSEETLNDHFNRVIIKTFLIGAKTFVANIL